jgi:integrase
VALSPGLCPEPRQGAGSLDPKPRDGVALWLREGVLGFGVRVADRDRILPLGLTLTPAPKENPMTPLRKKMDEDLRLRDLGQSTRNMYLRYVEKFAQYFGKSPDKLGAEDVREFLLHLDLAGYAASTRACYHAALRFLYRETLARPDVMTGVPRPRVKRHVEVAALTKVEVQILLDALADSPFDYTFFATMLATGLRISECCSLATGDLDRRAGLVHVRRGKGGKPRTVMLSAKLLRLLERYWVVERPPGPWLFPAQQVSAPGVIDPEQRWADHPVSKKTMCVRLQEAVKRADLKRRVTSHDLRRTFATWLIEDGRNLRLVQVLLGHASPATTARYTKIRANVIASTRSPYDLL